MRAGVAARVGVLATIMACTSTSTELPEHARAGFDDAARGELDETDEIPAAPVREPEAQPNTESDTGSDETSVSSEEAPMHQGRLCSRPYGISSTPGKGSSTGLDADPEAKRAAARSWLAQGLEVQVDDLERQAWTPKLGVEFDRLDPSVDHVIEIFDAKGHRVRRLRLDFERRGSDDICLGFESFYATWQLRALATGARCGPCVTR
jgi:hypothetical protein